MKNYSIFFILLILFSCSQPYKAHEAKYEMLADDLKNKIKAEFWDKPVVGKINRQTLFATLLYHEIV